MVHVAAFRSFEPIFTEIADGAALRELARELPHQHVRLLARHGFGAVRLPLHAGGQDLTIQQTLSLVIALGAADANVAHIFRNHSLFVEMFVRHPTTDGARAAQQRVARGSLVGFATGEAATQPGRRDFRTSLTPDNDGFRLDGSKIYCTGSLFADLLMVSASNALGQETVSLVPVDRSGLVIEDDWDAVGQRMTGSGTTHFQNVRVHAQEVLSTGASTGQQAVHLNTFAQLFLTAVVAGIIRNACTDAASVVANRRRTFSHASSQTPVGDPLLQNVVGEISAAAFAAEAAVLQAGDALDAASNAWVAKHPEYVEIAHHAALAAARAKVSIDDLAQRHTSRLFDVAGASSTRRPLNLDRHWRNARTLATHNPSLYKAAAIGDFEISGTRLPANGYF